MVNKCNIILKSGPNAGKRCCDVRKWCKHNKKTCSCGFTSDYMSSMSEHMKKCNAGKTDSPPSKPKTTPKPKPIFKPKPTPTPISPYQELERAFPGIVETFVNEIKSLKEEVEHLRNKPPAVINNHTHIHNTVNFNNYNIAVMSGNFYDELKQIRGTSDAIDFLVSSAANNSPLTVLKELYFNGDPNEFPIASRNGRYRYLNDDGQLVEDDGKIIEQISGRIQKAMSYATGSLIKRSVDDVEVDRLFDTYDLGKIQHNILNFPSSQFGADINSVTENANHPFFLDGVVVICLE